jgi:two-component system CheB/CheR fusion protein
MADQTRQLDPQRNAVESTEANRDGRMAPTQFPVVGIGASAGGLEAFSQLLSNLSAETGMAFVLIQHLDPKHNSQLTDLLAKATSLPKTS